MSLGLMIDKKTKRFVKPIFFLLDPWTCPKSVDQRFELAAVRKRYYYRRTTEGQKPER